MSLCCLFDLGLFSKIITGWEKGIGICHDIMRTGKEKGLGGRGEARLLMRSMGGGDDVERTTLASGIVRRRGRSGNEFSERNPRYRQTTNRPVMEGQ